MTPDPPDVVDERHRVPYSTLDAFLRSSPSAIATAVITGRGPLYHAIERDHLTRYPVGPLHVPPTRTPYVVRARRRASVGVLWIADTLEAVALRMRR